MSSVSEGIVAIDASGIVTHYNPAAERILHLSRQQVIGNPLTKYLPVDLPLIETLRNGAAYNNREIVLEKTRSHYLASGRPIFDHSGRIIGAVSVVMLIIGGIRYTTSQGDSSAVTSAKNTILYAVIGLVVAILAYAIVNFVVDRLT